MKRIIILITVLLVVGISQPVSTQNSCGQGILQRVDGGLIIDSFTIFTGTIAPGMPSLGKPGPTSITFGKTLPDDLPLCIETSNGSHCISLKTIRTLK